MMSIRYSLTQNYLLTRKKLFRATVHPREVVQERDIYERMSKSGSTLTQTDIIACMHLYNDTLQQYLTEGCYVNTRHGNYRPGIKGVFDSPNENFSETKHQKHVSISPSTDIETAIKEAPVEKVAADLVAPQPAELLDSKSGLINSTVTPGNIARLTGARLGFNKSNNLAGLFFVASDGSETKVSDILDNTNGKVNFLIPNTLSSGDYHLEVRAAYTQNNEIRIGQLTATLSVS